MSAVEAASIEAATPEERRQALACLAGGIVVVCGLESGDVAFARSADGGQTFAAASGTVAAAATMSDAGFATKDDMVFSSARVM